MLVLCPTVQSWLGRTEMCSHIFPREKDAQRTSALGHRRSLQRPEWGGGAKEKNQLEICVKSRRTPSLCSQVLLSPTLADMMGDLLSKWVKWRRPGNRNSRHSCGQQWDTAQNTGHWRQVWEKERWAARLRLALVHCLKSGDQAHRPQAGN